MKKEITLHIHYDDEQIDPVEFMPEVIDFFDGLGFPLKEGEKHE